MSTLDEDIKQIRRQAMRRHPFVGEGRYCENWSKPARSGGPQVGMLTVSAQCGYPRDLHPEQGKDS